jgi:hypothetical protein
MKSYLDEENEEDEEENVKSYTSLIFNAQSPTTKNELLAALPRRTAVDLLVSRYFNSNSPALRMFHICKLHDFHMLIYFQPSFTDQHFREMYVRLSLLPYRQRSLYSS